MKLIELDELLHVPTSLYDTYHKDSIMEYGKVCNHDSGYMCECRLEYLKKYLRNKKMKTICE